MCKMKNHFLGTLPLDLSQKNDLKLLLKQLHFPLIRSSEFLKTFLSLF